MVQEYLNICGWLGRARVKVAYQEALMKKYAEEIGTIWLVKATGHHGTRAGEILYAHTDLQEAVRWAEKQANWIVADPDDTINYLPVRVINGGEWHVAHIVPRYPLDVRFQEAVVQLNKFLTVPEQWYIKGLSPDFTGTYIDCIEMCIRVGSVVRNNVVYYEGREVGRLIKK